MATCDLHGYAPRPGQQSPPNIQPFVNLVKGAVGSGAATSFLQYLRQLRIPDPEAVLDGAAQVDPTLREDELLVLFETMSHLLQKMSEDAKNEDAENKERLKVAHAPLSWKPRRSSLMLRKADSIYTVFRRLIHGDRERNQVREEPVRRGTPGG
jgi:hypothetical protein